MARSDQSARHDANAANDKPRREQFPSGMYSFDQAVASSSASAIVFVVDDEQSVRNATRRVLRAAGYAVKTAESTTELFIEGRPETPCCVVLDLCMPGENGLEFQRRLTKQGFQIPLIFISGHGSIPASVQAMKGGACDFLPKPFDSSQLIGAVARALDNDARLLAKRQHSADARACFESLTDREREIFAAVAAGLLNKQIADELGIAEKTVKVHRGRVMEKMRAVALADLVRLADMLELRWQSPNNTQQYSQISRAELH